MTEELVIMRDRQAVTTSLQVAQNFERNISTYFVILMHLNKMCPILDRCLLRVINLPVMDVIAVFIT